MITLAAGTRVWLAVGRTDMRKGFDGLSSLVQQTLAQDPFCGHLFVFRGRRGDLLKVLWYDGQGLCLFAKRLERGRFVWPSPADGKVVISSAIGHVARGHRLADAATDVAATAGRLTHLGGSRHCDKSTQPSV